MKTNHAPLLDRMQLLNSFVDFLKNHLKEDLVSVVLFGSAAENRIRAHSDINLLIVLKSCQLSVLDKIKSEYRDQHNLIHVSCMFLEHGEIINACQSFPLKFLDISKRHQVLAGENIVKEFRIDSSNLKFQLQQTIMNLRLRLRERYSQVSQSEEQLVHIMNEFSGPLRSVAFSLISMNGTTANNPKEALAIFLETHFPQQAQSLARTISDIRESSTLAPELIEPTYRAFMDVLNKMYSTVRA